MKKILAQHVNFPKRERLPDLISSQIKSLIFSNEIEVGEKFPSERELEGLFGVSRVVVREALRSLEHSGLIEIKRGSGGGAFVSNKTYKPFSDSLKDLFSEGKLTVEHFVQARTAVECYGVRLAVENMTEEDLHSLKRINEELVGAIADTKRLGEKNMAFHLSIAELSGNPLITMMVQSLIETLDRILKTRTPRRFQEPNFAEATYKRHKKIIDAMRKKDVALCEKLIAKDAEFTKRINY